MTPMSDVIPLDWKVPERFRERVGRSAGRQRAMIDSGHLLLILHEVPPANDAKRLARLFWRQPDGRWEESAEGKRPSGADGLSALKRLVESYSARANALDDAVDEMRAADALVGLLREATPVARAARHLAAALQDARNALGDKDIITLRDQAQEVERSLELVLADAHLALQHIEARSAEAQAEFTRKAAEAQHRLNLLGATFFPVTAVGAVLGMNLRNGLESAPVWVFWCVCVAAFTLGMIVRGTLSGQGSKRQ